MGISKGKTLQGFIPLQGFLKEKQKTALQIF